MLLGGNSQRGSTCYFMKARHIVGKSELGLQSSCLDGCFKNKLTSPARSLVRKLLAETAATIFFRLFQIKSQCPTMIPSNYDSTVS